MACPTCPIPPAPGTGNSGQPPRHALQTQVQINWVSREIPEKLESCSAAHASPLTISIACHPLNNGLPRDLRDFVCAN
ncbi:hypothetical protein RRG08_040782 [Elysia crispata]|uniref:Uncharacterized protein n=1 Tax=Elysia crispata TaxID=231223 RepID=A0AAE1BDU2_9GAST|nr:hypothetical protein RRG08_040782 [Elysia crispata]